MSFQPVLISAYDAGLTKNKKPFLLIDKAFQELNNAFIFRERAQKRNGIKLVGRMRRVLTTQSLSATLNANIYNNASVNIFTTLGLLATEPNAEIEPGSFVINFDSGGGSDTILTDAGDGTLVLTATNNLTALGGTINYVTGQVSVAFSAAIAAGLLVTIDVDYYPALPAMGIDKREIAAINVEQTLFFDTKYVYSFNGDDFSSPSATTWAGDDADFFWSTNYRGVTPDSRVFFTTNGAAPGADPFNRIRYTTDAATWVDLEPVVGGAQITGEVVGTAVGNTFNGTLLNFPIIPGTVSITVENDTDPIVGFRDQFDTPLGILNGSAATNSGTIDYDTGDIVLTFDPILTKNSTVTATYQYNETSLYQALIIIPYYGRLLALNVYEGTNAGTATNIFNRCRFSQVGDPLQVDAWISSIQGKGGFIDAPTNESIVSAKFYKNTLIVYFERTTWQLRYVGEYGLPFIWERISSDFGSESTFSTVLFDSGVLAVGDKAIVGSSGNDVQRIDLDIPNTVFEFNNQEDGKERVHGIRDFNKEIVYWTYSDGGYRRKFPNRSLIYNYRNNTWATFRDNVTVFGELTTPTGILWDLPISWDSETSWDTSFPAEFPAIVSGNQQGWVHWYQYLDAETTADASTNMNEHESLSITDITLSATADISLEIINHNLESLEIIYITGLLFADVTGFSAVSTDLNDSFYIVTRTDDDNVTLEKWNFDDEIYESTKWNLLGFTPDPADGDTYMGGGKIALIQNISIITKDFNPFVKHGSQIKMSYADFMTDATPNSAISVNMIVNSSDNPDTKGNLLVGNQSVETAINQFGRISNITQATIVNGGAQVTSNKHGLLDGQIIMIRDAEGMIEINSNDDYYTVTYFDENNYTLNVDSSGFTAYTRGGQWISQDNRFYIPGSNYAWHRYYATCYGQYLAFKIFYDDNLMNSIETHQSGFELNAMQLWVRAGGRVIF